jgi:DNA excision repair protein ERCC-4
MALPLQADGRPASEVEDRPLRAFNSRAAGGQLAATSDAPRIVVDMREFRSSLPSMLHRQGVEVKPATLTVGDYILSPTMCVERKSIPDLIGSFNSGRLYNQCELMSVHYTHPILLIEFDEEKSFSSETISGPRGSGAPKRAITAMTKPEQVDIQTKLVMLTIAFQRLRIIWSSSPEATAAVFLELKAQYDEPDVARVTAVGQQEGGDEGGGGFNLTPQEVLLALPGINTKNFRFVMSAVRDVQELCDLTLAEMQRLIGVEPGRRLYNFVNSDVKRDRTLLS